MSENAEANSTNALEVKNDDNASTTPIGVTKTASHNLNDVDETPRILCNELLVKPQKSASLEKLDELCSLEQEIAKMHHVDDDANTDGTAQSAATTQFNNSDSEKEKLSTSDPNLSNGANEHSSGEFSRQPKENLEDKLDAITSGETALEHEDLIAVLKGLDCTSAPEADSHEKSGISDDLVLEEGVTIEGEGEYQIMEVIDDDSTAVEEPVKSDAPEPPLNKTKTFGSTSLTAQEERALALEQIEVLKTAKPRRRKQDIKPIKQVDAALDLVSALEAEWSENDDDVITDKSSSLEDTKKPSSSLVTTTTKTSKSAAATENKTNSAIITSVVVIPTQLPSTTSTNTTTPSTANTKTASASDDKKMSAKSSTSPTEGGVIETKTEEHITSPPGFRRTRIIKRKIIWDPDAPETTFSYAKLVKPNNTNKTKNEAIPTITITKGSTTITPLKKDTSATGTTAAAAAATKVVAKKTQQRPITPRDKKLTTELNTEKKISTKPSTTESNIEKKVLSKQNVSSTKTNAAAAIEASNKAEETATKTTKTSNAAETKTSPTPTSTAAARTGANSPAKRRSQTPVSNGPGGAGVKKKKITEVDRLMGDEGAVNMLNSLEKIENSLEGNETKPTRPMMRSRAATICEKLPRKESVSPGKTAASPTNTTTTQTTTASTNQQKGKRNSKPRASSSWDYVYKQKSKDFDDSLIIRRRSNSSYSSTTSLNRLSLDGPPSSIANSNSTTSATSSNDAKSSPATTTTPTAKTPPSENQTKSAGSSKNSTPTSAGKSFEFAKPENKKAQRRTKSPAATLTTDMKKSAPAAGKRNTRSPATVSGDDGKDVVKSPTKLTASTSSNSKEKKDSTPLPGTVSDVVVKKSSKVAQIIFSTNKAKLTNTFTIQMLNKLVDILDKLASDPDCHIVVMATNDTHFCQGVDITDLTKTSAEKRKNYSTHLAMAVKNYLKTLANYPKPLIAGINGNIMNLGVMQLALFDIVIAGEKTTFETPYIKMGQMPEGFSIWNNMNKIRGSFKTKLFWLCERIQSTEAALAGLVNKLTVVNKVNEEALSTAKRIASYSAEAYRGIKKTVINSHSNVIDSCLDEEFEKIIRQWSSNECLENMKKIVEQGHY